MFAKLSITILQYVRECYSASLELRGSLRRHRYGYAENTMEREEEQRKSFMSTGNIKVMDT